MARANNYRSDAWEQLAADLGMEPEKVKGIASGAEGKALFRENIGKGEGLGVAASPTLLLDNRTYGGKLTPPAVASVDCQGSLSVPVAWSLAFSSGLAPFDSGCCDYPAPFGCGIVDESSCPVPPNTFLAGGTCCGAGQSNLPGSHYLAGGRLCGGRSRLHGWRDGSYLL